MSTVTRASVDSASAHLLVEIPLAGVAHLEALERSSGGIGHQLEVLQPALLEARLGLGHDPEVDDPEGGRRDEEEQQRDLVAI